MLLGSTVIVSPYWLTFQQVQRLEGRVRKGEKSELMIFWKFFDRGQESDDLEKGNERKSQHRPLLLRYYRVFNIEQTESLDKHLLEPRIECQFTPIETVAKIIESMPQQPLIQQNQQSAYYSPMMDYVNLPRSKTFDTPENYYAVTFYELTHATGHESRLKRLVFQVVNSQLFSKITHAKS